MVQGMLIVDICVAGAVLLASATADTEPGCQRGEDDEQRDAQS